MRLAVTVATLSHPEPLARDRVLQRAVAGSGAHCHEFVPEALPLRVSIAFLLSPGFCLFSVSAAIEAFDTANRLARRSVYTWRFVSLQERNVESAAGVSLECSSDIAGEMTGNHPTDIVFVACDRPASQILMARVRRYLQTVHRRGAKLVATGGGTLLLAEAGFLDGKRCAVHWQHLPEFDARYPRVDADCHLYEVGDRLMTCAGQTASLDLAMNLVRLDLGAEIASQLCNHHVVEQVRSSRHRQRRPDLSSIEINNPRLAAAIAIMKTNLSEPLPLVSLAKRIGMSRRQVERLFEVEGQQAPARFYLFVRLEKAQKMLQMTDMSIVEVGRACGFISASHFSKCYRKRFGHSPRREREPF